MNKDPWDEVRDYDTSDFKEAPVQVVPGIWDKEIAEVDEFLSTMGDKPVKQQLNQLLSIKDCRKFIEREMEVARAQNGNVTFRPYMDRALAVVRKLKRSNHG